MTATITHKKVSSVPDSADTNDVRMSDWNDTHDASISAADVGAEASGAVATHAGASDPHADRAFAAAAVATHAAAGDPHPTYETSAEAAAKVTTHEGASDPHTGYQKESEKDAANGYAGLGAGSKLSASQLPNPSSSTLGGVQSKASATSKFLTQIGTDGVVASAQPVAADVTFTPTGSIAATDVQAAIAEMLSEGITQLFQVPFSRQGTISVTTDSTALRWYNRSGRTLTFTMVELAIVTAPTGAAVLVDVNVDGTTIFSTQSNRPTIAISGNEGNSTTFNTATVADGHYITVNIDQVGSTVVGADLAVVVWMKG